MNESFDEINGRNWADWSLENIDIGFQELNVIVCNDGGDIYMKISCRDYIGIEMLGHWDESIIEDINVAPGGKLASDSIEAVKKHYGGEPPAIPGCNKRMDDEWVELDIGLIDGVHLRVACKDIQMLEVSQEPEPRTET